jgi:hypothetical protein
MSHQAAVPQKRLTPDESYDVWKHLSKDARCIIDTDCGLCFDSRCTSSNDFCANSEFDGNDLAPLLAMTDFNHSHWDILQHTHTSHKIVILAVAINTKAATKWRDYYKASMNGEKPETGS